MFSQLRTSLPFRVFLLAVLVAFLRVGSLQAQTCPAVYNNWGTRRPCTLTEHFGYCLDNVLVSYNQCLQSGQVATFFCDGGAAFDLLGCAAKLPIWTFLP